MLDKLEQFQFAPGFRATATKCGLKPSGNLDLALIAADRPCSAAAVFTTNRVKAAPVLYDQKILQRNAATIRAVITNAGCANAVTGPQGLENAQRTAELVAYGLRCLPDEILVLSTGVIGRQLDMDKMTQGIAEVTSPAAALHGGAYVARAIMTTDTRPKVASVTLPFPQGAVTISGCCKGAGMIHPNMATLLAIVTTDAKIEPALLDQVLRYAVERSFNRISVDGDTSTNDTLLVLASGVSGVRIDDELLEVFTAALTAVCVALAKQVARDGEGATKLVEIQVSGARDDAMAHMVANAIAKSPLVKCALHGNDPNWGRILCATGYSGADVDPQRISLAFGPPERAVTLLVNGMPVPFDEPLASGLLREDPTLLRLDLGLGEASTTVWTCDMSEEYVTINADYTT
jgi:glutamate N-acetyltransferase/amino-acid N-acetyltransferase